jgi:PAS domain S-box-containing protein
LNRLDAFKHIRFPKLREDAEKALESDNFNSGAIPGSDLDVVFQELQVHQIELEMQNDELRISNEELEIQRMMFAGIYDLAPIGYFILDRNGIIERVNTVGILQLGTGIITGKRLFNFIAPDYIDRYLVFLKKVIQSSENQSCQLKFQIKGKQFYAQVEGNVIYSPNNDVQCYIAVIDITDRIMAEQKLTETKERLELALLGSAAGAWELDLNTMHITFDAASYELCNISPESFTHQYQAFIDLIYKADRFLVDQHFRTAINTDNPIDIECRFINEKDKVCYINIRGHLIDKSDDKKSIIGIMMDVTEKKTTEQEAEQLKLDQQKNITTATVYAEENERRRISEALHDSVSQLLYGIKIQLNQIDETNRNEAVRKLNKLLDTVIHETRNIAFELAPSILKDFGLEIAIKDMIKRLAMPGLIINVKVTGFQQRPDLMFETNIFRIIQELVNNCMKHAAATIIKIEIKKTESIEIVVKDNGKGFAELKNNTKPIGSGLSSIRNRLSLYDGTLSIETSEKGTIVTACLNYNSAG